MQKRPFRLYYHFEFQDGKFKEYEIMLEPESLSMIHVDGDPEPAEWTNLDYEQCSCCPLTIDTHPQCPIAVNIMESKMIGRKRADW